MRRLWINPVDGHTCPRINCDAEVMDLRINCDANHGCPRINCDALCLQTLAATGLEGCLL